MTRVQALVLSALLSGCQPPAVEVDSRPVVQRPHYSAPRKSEDKEAERARAIDSELKSLREQFFRAAPIPSRNNSDYY